MSMNRRNLSIMITVLMMYQLAHTALMKVKIYIKIAHPEIALHLDHGDSFETCKSCVDYGFSSVMIDGSSLPYEENVALTKKVVEYAHQFDVTVEGNEFYGIIQIKRRIFYCW